MTKITIDPEFAALLPPLAGDERAELEASLRRDGCLSPLITWRGLLVDGHHRFSICTECGIDYDVKDLDVWCNDGWVGDPICTRDNAMEWMILHQRGRRNVTNWRAGLLGEKLLEIEKRRAKERKAMGGGDQKSDREIFPHPIEDAGRARDKAAKAVGISGRTLEKVIEINKVATPEQKAALERGEVSVEKVYREIKPKAELVTESVHPVPHIARGESSCEWYTPEDIIARVRATMGEIDLDPASCAAANNVVGAVQYYSADDDGTKQPWAGRVFINPPYGKGVVDAFAQKARDEWSRGDVTEMIVLVNNATETAWFGNLVSCAKMICFPSGRVRYWRTDGDSDAPTQGQAILYCGYNEQSFIANFSSLGWLVDVV